MPDFSLPHFLKNNVDSFLAALAGIFIIYLYTLHSGIGLSPDSITYMSTAENLHTSGKLVDFSGYPVMEFPAGYPFFLAGLIYLTGHDPQWFAPAINAGLFALVILTSGWIMDRFTTTSTWYKRAILSCIVLSPGILEVYSMLWSETIFILLALFFFLALHRFLDKQDNKSLLGMICLAAMACVVRLIGVTLLATGIILILAYPGRRIIRKIRTACVLGAGGSVLLILNLVHNEIISGTLAGHREKSIRPFWENLHYFGSVLHDWLIFWNNSTALSICLTILVAGGLSLLAIQQVISRKHFGSQQQITLVFFAVYAITILIVSGISKFERIDSRLISPLFIPMLWGATSWIPAQWSRSTPIRRRWLMGGCLVLFLGFQTNQLMADYANYDGIKDAGIPGYAEDSWQQSPTVQYLKQHIRGFHAGYTIYTDADDAIFFFTGEHAVLLPHKDSPGDIADFYADPHYYIVWFNDGYDPDLISMHNILAKEHPVVLASFVDGIIYIYPR
ncbi:MAG TPA: hypothetical protein VNE41_07690 [Chitinophagaceae bacterium]|nr:hypothetical protein [Chitinophagaceae bacterium]